MFGQLNPTALLPLIAIVYNWVELFIARSCPLYKDTEIRRQSGCSKWLKVWKQKLIFPGLNNTS